MRSMSRLWALGITVSRTRWRLVASGAHDSNTPSLAWTSVPILATEARKAESFRRLR